MSFLTWRWDFPQKLQRSCSFDSVGRAKRSPLSMMWPGASTQITTRGPWADPPCYSPEAAVPSSARRLAANWRCSAGAERVAARRSEHVARATVARAVVLEIGRVRVDRVVEQAVVVGVRVEVDPEVAVVANRVVAHSDLVAVVEEDAAAVGLDPVRGVVVDAVARDDDDAVEPGVLDDHTLVVQVAGVIDHPQLARPGVDDAADIDPRVGEAAHDLVVAHLDRASVEDVDPVLGATLDAPAGVVDEQVVNLAGRHPSEVDLRRKVAESLRSPDDLEVIEGDVRPRRADRCAAVAASVNHRATADTPERDSLADVERLAVGPVVDPEEVAVVRLGECLVDRVRPRRDLDRGTQGARGERERCQRRDGSDQPPQHAPAWSAFPDHNAREATTRRRPVKG